MRKTALFIAMSLDGYIADQNGGVGWLGGQTGGDQTADPYSSFIQDVDTVIMGWNTYHQIVTELSPEHWVYQDLTSYVITHRPLPPAEHIIFTQLSPCDLIQKLKQKQGKTIWICGGAAIIQPLLHAGLIDEYYISIIPTILGSGIRLFEELPGEIKLKLIRTQVYDGIAELIYTHR